MCFLSSPEDSNEDSRRKKKKNKKKLEQSVAIANQNAAATYLPTYFYHLFFVDFIWMIQFGVQSDLDEILKKVSNTFNYE